MQINHVLRVFFSLVDNFVRPLSVPLKFSIDYAGVGLPSSELKQKAMKSKLLQNKADIAIITEALLSSQAEKRNPQVHEAPTSEEARNNHPIPRSRNGGKIRHRV